MRSVAIIGCGPRGLTVAERLLSMADAPLRIEIFEPNTPGSGAVWRTDQSPQMLMNTASSQVTAFMDPTVELRGPLRQGPTLHEWAHSSAATHWLPPGLHNLAESLQPDEPAQRRFYGHYLEWHFSNITNEQVRVHKSKVTRVAPFGDQWQVEAPAATVRVDAVVLALGHVVAAAPPDAQVLLDYAKDKDALHILPGNAADANLSTISAGETVLIKGLGLGFFDYLAELTLGRGGEFRDGKYHPSGREPRIVAGSPGGLPYRGKREMTTRYTPEHLTKQAVEALIAKHQTLDFMRDIWPLAVAEVEHHFPSVDWQRVLHPPVNMDRWPQWLQDYLQEDARWCEPIRDCWDAIELSLAHLSAHSFSEHFQGFFTAVNSSNLMGPPQMRLEQLSQLIAAGVVELPGPDFVVDPDLSGTFVGYSKRNPTKRYPSRVVIEARVPNPDITVTADPLLRQLIDDELIVERVRTDSTGTAHTGAVDIHEPSMQVRNQPGLYCFGISVDGVTWPAAETAEPYTKHGILRRADTIAAAILLG
ncbi:FAD/NAD(P)-binding protein [Corynebacterium kozikiae]|uniref:FAD/NAD(P)-binding protein n=1 Tax=Corynebacterium kozikiae TaxID=2968469 RepID=UPI00211CFC7C|nr:FAD/NAD(P)-binding domain-containing protein [Corynebacterium sp. 76QC2CO]MCQ9343999.1 FAD/NAD(P)-binding protein [Corynebacterium sp. 76QC2CO]